MNLPQWSIDAKKSRDAATPGEYETRRREFSNHAALEIWTDIGWLDQLPKSYREPTYSFFAASPTNQDRYHRALEIALECLQQIKKEEEYYQVYWGAQEAIAQIESLK